MLCPKSSQIEFLLVALSNSKVPQDVFRAHETNVRFICATSCIASSNPSFATACCKNHYEALLLQIFLRWVDLTVLLSII